jgi:hypothetical protein
VHQDPPNDAIKVPSREEAGRTATIRFGPVGTGFDLARLAWPSEEYSFSSQTTILSEL